VFDAVPDAALVANVDRPIFVHCKVGTKNNREEREKFAALGRRPMCSDALLYPSASESFIGVNSPDSRASKELRICRYWILNPETWDCGQNVRMPLRQYAYIPESATDMFLLHAIVDGT
jgi:hypothetical protein